ncbi:hypothetical protein AAIH25_14955 [Arthrobacter crystallopoietes]|uniref:hypothetical protein n=1 Tax=Crystallibacter crystallopoietes TaxID=37928 RepID=UPI003D1F1B21
MEKNRKAVLPAAARAKLAEKIYNALSRPLNFTGPHTMPVSQESWQHYAHSLNALVMQLQERAEDQPEDPNSFESLRSWIEETLSLRDNIISLALALRPFEHFQEKRAEAMMSVVNRLTLAVAEVVQRGQPASQPAGVDIHTHANWSSVECTNQEDPLSRAFGLDSEDLNDENGEFSPARVFSAYYLQNNKLLQRVLSHLHSMGLPAVVDPLVAVSIVGWIESASDAVGAYCVADALFNTLLPRSNQDVVVAALRHLGEIEPRLRQSRFRANRSSAASSQATDLETAAMHLAEGYKRLLEGPVRHYGWLYHCVGTRNWAAPPMLTSLREVVLKDQGWLAKILEPMILTEVRNGEAHESLLWDGLNEVFVTESGPVVPARVHVAAVKADAFARGSQAAVACFRALSIQPRAGGPVASDPGRSAAWLRAEAHFGTNGLQVTKSNFNSKTAKITVSHFASHNINPCFQALVCCHVLVPEVSRFEIYAEGRGDAILSVSAEALRRTQSVWKRAIDKFSSMPLSTFLPANLDARRTSENPAEVVRSVAWIAVDDLLDAIDSSPPMLDGENLKLLVERVELVVTATEECLAAVPAEFDLDLHSVHSLAEALLEELEILRPPTPVFSLDEKEAVDAARRFWDAWGRVPRLPGVAVSSQTNSGHDHGPRLRQEEARLELRWRTI